MSHSRRIFLRNASASVAAAAIPYSFANAQRSTGTHNTGALSTSAVPMSEMEADISALMARGLDAARTEGAAFADVRYRASHGELLRYNGLLKSECNVDRGIGIRAFYNGYWGYAAITGECTSDEVAKAGRDAAAQAKTGAKGKPRSAELASRPVVTNGRWTTPIEVDPFTVSWDEKVDVVSSIVDYFSSKPFNGTSFLGDLEFWKREQMYAASDGASYQQTLHTTAFSVAVGVMQDWRTHIGGYRRADDILNRVTAGWEYIYKLPELLEANANRLIQQSDDMRFVQPVDVGRYDVVFDGEALGKLAALNIGAATALDRAMGYTANTVGTSYLNDPLGMLGTFKVGSPLLNVTANRSMPQGFTTVKWDDEGVEPDEAVLVKDGILTDFQTTRESASWLAPYYQKTGKTVRSHGGSMGGVYRAPEQGPHNLVIEPSRQATSFEDLYSGVKKGLAVFGGRSSSDQQVLNSETYPELVYEIINGKITRTIRGAVILSRAPDFWKNLIGVGGTDTVRQSYAFGMEGERTISAPAVLVKNVAVATDLQRGGFIP